MKKDEGGGGTEEVRVLHYLQPVHVFKSASDRAARVHVVEARSLGKIIEPY